MNLADKHLVQPGGLSTALLDLQAYPRIQTIFERVKAGPGRPQKDVLTLMVLADRQGHHMIQ